MILCKHEDIYYLTGFYGKYSNSILVISPQKIYLLVNFIFYEDALSSTGMNGLEVVLYKGNRIKKAAEVVSSLKIKNVAVESSHMNHSDFIGLSRELKKCRIKTTACKGIMNHLRSIKDRHELNNISQACRITDLAFSEIVSYGHKKMSARSELALVNEIEGLCIKNGGNGRSFDYVIASGPDTSKPHYCPSHKNISGELLLMDFGTIHERYCSDITRTVFLQEKLIGQRLNDIYKIVLEAQLKSIDACKEGIRCDELDSIARRHIKDSGYGDQFGHGLGHGVGLEVHEEPYITRKNKTVLKKNMVITIEPGIYIPGLGGVRIEDMVVVEKSGCRNLYTSKKDFTFLS